MIACVYCGKTSGKLYKVNMGSYSAKLCGECKKWYKKYCRK